MNPVRNRGRTPQSINMKTKKTPPHINTISTSHDGRPRPASNGMKAVKIGDRLVGENQPIWIVAEIGINHNGDIEIAKKLIDEAVRIGCDAVKFQKRTVDIVYTTEELAKPRT